MKFKFLSTGALVTALLLSGCGEDAGESTGLDEPTAFQVGDVVVSEEILEYWISERSSRGNVASAAQRETLTAELIELIQLAELAKERELDQAPQAVISQWRTMAQAARNDLGQGEIKDVTTAELREIFSQEAEFQTTPERRKVAALWLPAREQNGMSLETAREFYHEQAELFAQNLDAGFGSLSVDYSFHRPTRYKGGILGWMTELPVAGEMRQEWQDAAATVAFEMNAGSVSEVVETAKGDELLVLVMDVKAGKAVSYEESLPRLQDIWKMREQERTQKELTIRLSREFPVKN